MVRFGSLEIHAVPRSPTHALRALEPDVVHAHGEFNPNNWWPPRLWSSPLVLTPHGAFHPTVLQRGAKAKRLYIGIAQRLLYERTRKFHALSPAEGRDIKEAVRHASTYCVPQGPSPEVQKALGPIEPRFRERPRQVRFMYVGRIDVPTKGLDVLLEAFAQATGSGAASRAATLTLVGPDQRNGRVALRDLASRLGIEHRVEIRDQVTGHGVTALLRDCDVYVQLSRNDGSPLSLNDALVLAKPAIISERVGTASWEEIKRLRHVKVVEPSVAAAADAIAEVLEDAASLGQEAREACPLLRTFLSWENAARRHLETYEALLAEP